MKTLCIVAPSVVFLSSLSAQEVLNNDSIVELVKAGMSEEIVLNMVKTQPAKFELGADEVLALKTGGVSEKIISAMILRGQGVGAISAASQKRSTQTRLHRRRAGYATPRWAGRFVRSPAPDAAILFGLEQR